MKKNILLLNLAGALIWMSMYAYVPTLPAYAQTLQATTIMIGIIGGIYGVTQLLLRIPLGIISDRLNKDKLLIIIGFVVLAVSNAMFLFANTPLAIIVARGTAGAAAAWWVIISVSYSRYFDDSQQIKAQGVLSATCSVGKLLAAILGGLVAQWFGLKAPFVFALVVSIIGILMLFSLKDKKVVHEKSLSFKDFVAMFKNKALMGFSVLGILSQFLCFAVPTTFSVVAAKDLGADSFSLGIINFVFFLSVALVSLLVGTKLYNKIGGRNMLAIAFLFGVLSCIPFFYHINIVAIFLMQVFSGICYGITQAALAGYVIKCVPSYSRSTATGIYQSMFAIGIFVGPMLFGVLFDSYSFDFALEVFAIVMFISAILCYFLIPKEYNRG